MRFLVIILAVFFISSGFLEANSDNIIVYGHVNIVGLTNYESAKLAVIDNEDEKKYDVNKNGRYELTLKFNKNYVICFEKEGFVSQKIKINTKNIPYSKRTFQYLINKDISLFKKTKGKDLSIFENPIDKATNDKSSDDKSDANSPIFDGVIVK